MSPLLQRWQHSVQDEKLAGGLHQLLIDLRGRRSRTRLKSPIGEEDVNGAKERGEVMIP